MVIINIMVMLKSNLMIIINIMVMVIINIWCITTTVKVNFLCFIHLIIKHFL